MHVHQIGIGHRRSERLAFEGLRLVLAVVFSALGCALLFVPGVAEGLARSGYGAGFRFLLGVCNIAGGIALLLSRLVLKVALVLALLVAGITVYLLAESEGIVTIEPTVVAIVLLLFGAWLRFRRRAEATAWRAMLGRYADHQDRIRTELPS